MVSILVQFIFSFQLDTFVDVYQGMNMFVLMMFGNHTELLGGIHGNVMVKALLYKSEGRGFETRLGE
jgi:hypothetical protein